MGEEVEGESDIEEPIDGIDNVLMMKGRLFRCSKTV